MFKLLVLALLALASCAPAPHPHHHQRTVSIGLGLGSGYGYGYGSGLGLGGLQTGIGYPGLIRSPVVTSPILGSGSIISPLSTGAVIQPTYVQPAVIAQPVYGTANVGYGSGYGLGNGFIG